MNPIELGKFIAKLRNEKKLTQEELAEKLYIDKRKISRWECGNSIPDFDMLIKLSEILDVSLYELSICKRIENESLNRKIINKFKSIKDLKKYNGKAKLKFIIIFILLIVLIISTSYTIKNNNTVSIYEINSLDNKYYLEGNYIHVDNYNLFYIKNFSIKDNIINYKYCNYELYSNDTRILVINNDNKRQTDLSHKTTYFEITTNKLLNNNLSLKIKCDKNKEYDFKINLNKIYSNSLIKR